MKNYALFDNEYKEEDRGVIFQWARFFRLHDRQGGHYFEWAAKEKVFANVHFTPIGCDGLWRSPAKGTFAGFYFDSSLKTEELWAFSDSVELALRNEGAKCLEVLLAPMAHDPVSTSNQMYMLISRGYQISQCDLNHSLEVDERPLSERMTYGNRKRLAKCQREGFIGELLSSTALPKVYETLTANRSSKGHHLSMTLGELQIMVDTFPDAVVLFGCRDGKQLAAAGLCIHLSPTVLYVLYWGDQPGYASLSPVVAIADAVHSYAQNRRIKIIDVGVSTLSREPNFGLIEFKRGLGFEESLKVRMMKYL